MSELEALHVAWGWYEAVRGTWLESRALAYVVDCQRALILAREVGRG